MSETPEKNEGPAKQLNIRLPEQMHRELKAKCALDGFTLAGAIEELARAYLGGKVKLTRKTE